MLTNEAIWRGSGVRGGVAKTDGSHVTSASDKQKQRINVMLVKIKPAVCMEEISRSLFMGEFCGISVPVSESP